MTNNHVLASPAEASQTEVEFNYEHDVDGVLNPPIQFNLAPCDFFYTDIEHDVTFVAVSPLSDGGVPIERFGYLPLIPLSGKGLHGEWVTIIQHPGGQPKQLTVRASQIIERVERTFRIWQTATFITRPIRNPGHRVRRFSMTSGRLLLSITGRFLRRPQRTRRMVMRRVDRPSGLRMRECE